MMYPREATEPTVGCMGLEVNSEAWIGFVFFLGGQHIDDAGSGLGHLGRLCKMRKGLGSTGSWVT